MCIVFALKAVVSTQWPHQCPCWFFIETHLCGQTVRQSLFYLPMTTTPGRASPEVLVTSFLELGRWIQRQYLENNVTRSCVAVSCCKQYWILDVRITIWTILGSMPLLMCIHFAIKHIALPPWVIYSPTRCSQHILRDLDYMVGTLAYHHKYPRMLHCRKLL